MSRILSQDELREQIEKLEAMSIHEQLTTILKSDPKSDEFEAYVQLIESPFRSRTREIILRIRNLSCVRCQHIAHEHTEYEGACLKVGRKCECEQFAGDNLTFVEQESNRKSLDK